MHPETAQDDAQVSYSACVGGGTPMLETVDAVRASGQDIVAVRAVLNGTVNYLLDRLAEGGDFASCADAARAAGFAEADMSQDLSGADAATKLRLIARHAFGPGLRDIAVDSEPLDTARIADICRSGERWVQLATLAQDGGDIVARIRLVPMSSIDEFPVLPDEWNALELTTASGERHLVTDRGAGGAPTAESLFGDLVRLHHAAVDGSAT